MSTNNNTILSNGTPSIGSSFMMTYSSTSSHESEDDDTTNDDLYFRQPLGTPPRTVQVATHSYNNNNNNENNTIRRGYGSVPPPRQSPSTRLLLPDGSCSKTPHHFPHSTGRPFCWFFMVAMFLLTILVVLMAIVTTVFHHPSEHVLHCGLSKACHAQRVADQALIQYFATAHTDMSSTSSSSSSVVSSTTQAELLDLSAAATSSNTLHTKASSKHTKHDDTTTTPISSSPPVGCESTVMIIRHCEKGELKHHCTYPGFERAAYLATLFGNSTAERWPAPSSIYALRPQRHKNQPNRANYREVETVQPLADKLQLVINDQYKTSQHTKLAKHILQPILRGDQCGQLVLISWKHSEIPTLAQHLGCGPLQGCPLDYKGKEFDQVWQIKYVYEAFHHVKSSSKHSSQVETVVDEHWEAYGSLQNENFDPLAFSKQVGDYPQGGIPADKVHPGASWKSSPNQAIFYV